jgi:tetratricopeptide (TPR) repeat protein
VNGRDSGGGFALQSKTVITAAHVISNAEPSEIRYVPHHEAPEISVTSIDVESALDVAALRLKSDAPVAFRAAAAIENLRVRVDAAPHDHAPRLTGVVRATDWAVTLLSGTRTNVLQVGVDDALADYGGYSGCAVSSPEGEAVGVLIEQVLDPRSVRSDAPPLLFALPIQTAIEALHLNVTVSNTAADSSNRLAEGALTPPPPSPTFVARGAELEDLTQRWDEGAEMILLHGLPGGGKSSLAAEAAALAGGNFPDGILYFDLRGLDEPAGEADVALHQILDAIGVPQAAHPRALDQKTALARTIQANRRLLLVLDDIRDERQLRPLLVAGRNSSTLITSRSSLPAVTDLYRLEIEALGSEDGLKLFEQLIGEQRVRAELDEAFRMVELCGGLPLALRITGSRLATRPAWSIEEYADRLTDERRRLESLSLGDLDVRASFELSYRLLSADEQRALRHIGLLRSPTISAETIGAALNSNADDQLESLVDAGLLTLRGTRYEVHDLIRIFARDILDKDEYRRGLHHLGSFYAGEMNSRGEALRTKKSGDALRWMTEERATLEYLPSELNAVGLSELTISLALSFGPLAVPLHAWKMWERAIQIALEAALEQTEDPGEKALALTQNLGVVKERLGDEQEALRLFNQVLDTARSKKNFQLEARALAQLGLLAKRDERPEDAVEFLKASAGAYEKAGEEHGYAQALGDWANVLDDLGEHEEALTRHRDAAHRFLGLGDRYSYGLELGNAGIALQRLERPLEAAEEHLAALEAFESIGAHIPAAIAKWRRASAIWGQGKISDAEHLFAEAIEVLEAQEQYHELAELLSSREARLVRSGRFEEALEDALRAADLFAKTKDARNEALERARIGNLRRSLGKGTGSADLTQAEELFGVNNRPSSPRALALSQRAAEILSNGDSRAAFELWQQAVAMFQSIGMGWYGAVTLHLAAPLFEEAGQKGPAEKFREQMGELLSESSESLPRPWQDVSVSGTANRQQWALLFLWLARAVDETELFGAHEITIIPCSAWSAEAVHSFNADQMHVHPDLVDKRGVRAHFLLGWHIYSMLAGQELMRRGVRSDDEMGQLLLDLAGEWVAAKYFRDDADTPTFRTAPPPTESGHIRPLGCSLGAALTGSKLHLYEVDDWLQRHDDSSFRGVVEELKISLQEKDSSEDLLDTLAACYRERSPRGITKN